MASKRMFSLSVTDTDAFLDMPTSTQALYFHLGMHGDDDGFVGSPKKIVRSAGCGNDDLKLLITKGFIIPFDSGVVVIRDWSINNYIQNDRYRPTVYTAEKAKLKQDEAKRYILATDLDTPCIQTVSNMDTQISIDKVRLEENRKGESESSSAGAPTLDDVRDYVRDNGLSIDADRFYYKYAPQGWKTDTGNPITDWRGLCKRWQLTEAEHRKEDKPRNGYSLGSGQNPEADPRWQSVHYDIE